MRRIVLSLVVTAAAVAVVAVPQGAAQAAPLHGVGHSTSPAQPYQNNSDASDWLGSYVVDGQPGYVVQFAYLAPDSDEQYTLGGTLQTKWDTALAPDVAADVSYLMFAHGQTQDPDTAAALAHLLQSWTAAPQNPGQLDPANDFRHIAYDAPFHLAKLPASAQQEVATLAAEAASQRGPWTVTITPPPTTQVGRAGIWTVHVAAASGAPVTGRGVTLTASGADPASTGVQLDAGGDATVSLTPSRAAVALSAQLDGPRSSMNVRQAVEVDTARLLTSGDAGMSYDAAATSTAAPGVFAPGPRATLAGRPRVGRVLTASAGTTEPPGTAAFQWLADGAVVGTGPTYPLTIADLGKALQVTAVVSRPGYTTVTSTSSATKPVRLPEATLAVRVPKHAALGSRLLVRAGGLVPGERCTVHLGGRSVRSCRADAAGRVRVRVRVEGVLVGKRTVVVQGAAPRRRGADVVRVTPAA